MTATLTSKSPDPAGVPITLACALYDRMQALYTGDVAPQGIDLTFRVEDFPRKLFDHAMAEKTFDVCEMSSSDYVTRYLKGDCPFVALPVFPSKMFRHGLITINAKSGIRTPKDMEGRRIGVMRHTMTAAVYIRGHLQNDYGVDLRSIKWIEGSVNSPGMHGVPTFHPPGWDITVNDSDRSLSQLIDAGEIDGTIGTHLPDSLRTNPDVRRLFPDFHEVEKAYYQRTGVFPIMHLIAIKKDVYERNPFIAKSLFDAFEQSKRAALVRMRNYSALRYMLPWMPAELDELYEVFGDDPWTYGVEANRVTFATMIKFMRQQDMIDSEPTVEELFVPVG
ncbi:MAG: ABC transporter substrate-binding protein [Proteobacteria bacterium]|nr:ABC transporter substrate-binding protein [Burkholderiales bacterium]